MLLGLISVSPQAPSSSYSWNWSEESGLRLERVWVSGCVVGSTKGRIVGDGGWKVVELCGGPFACEG